MQLGLESFFNEKDVFIESGDFTFFFTPLAVARAQNGRNRAISHLQNHPINCFICVF